ncbi:hypothetical protein EYF80_032069 [Liparis tanakae]|uniref:Uncharacterized protein n=1 Tax=Liparis tanakae TaxID=230148 RepID=A0A4Z2GWN8_9TELE|nr:hypothetical protein EYF80_032069 [Liparis tanakae]
MGESTIARWWRDGGGEGTSEPQLVCHSLDLLPAAITTDSPRYDQGLIVSLRLKPWTLPTHRPCYLRVSLFIHLRPSCQPAVLRDRLSATICKRDDKFRYTVLPSAVVLHYPLKQKPRPRHFTSAPSEVAQIARRSASTDGSFKVQALVSMHVGWPMWTCDQLCVLTLTCVPLLVYLLQESTSVHIRPKAGGGNNLKSMGTDASQSSVFLLDSWSLWSSVKHTSTSLSLSLFCSSSSNRPPAFSSSFLTVCPGCLDFTCLSRSRLRTSTLPQNSHLYGVLPSAWSRMCLFRLLGSPNGRKHTLHLSGL